MYNMYKYTVTRGIFVKRIAIIPNYTKDYDKKYTKLLCEYLNGKATAVMHPTQRAEGIVAEYQEDIYTNTDAVIVLGGDGSMLQAAEPCGKNKIPVMGINLGKVGFMTEVEVCDMESACCKLLAGDYEVENRMMMDICVSSNNGSTSFIALNDAVIGKKDACMIGMEIYANSGKISEYLADGLIISTPTGSTGYSLSAGGPVSDPVLDLFIATPICAHTLSARPMLLSPAKDIELKLNKKGKNEATLTVDGVDKCTITENDIIRIQKSKYSLKLIKLGKQSFYYTMMAKL